MNMEYILNEHHRNVPDEELLQDVKDVAIRLKQDTLTIEDYQKHGKYHPTTLRRRFGSWKSILSLAELDIEKHNFQISNEDYVTDIKRVAEMLQKNTVTHTEYRKYGKYSVSKLSIRFGNWKNALEAANLSPTGYNTSVSDTELLEEIERIWIKLGRQPTTNDIKSGVSQYGLTTYLRHFGSWRKALEFFVQYINTEEPAVNPKHSRVTNTQKSETILSKHKTNRDVNLRLRFLVMKRDNFKCCICGATPATNPSVELHIDHIIPWSKGGETTIENLQTLCSKCNLGKSDLL